MQQRFGFIALGDLCPQAINFHVVAFTWALGRGAGIDSSDWTSGLGVGIVNFFFENRAPVQCPSHFEIILSLRLLSPLKSLSQAWPKDNVPKTSLPVWVGGVSEKLYAPTCHPLQRLRSPLRWRHSTPRQRGTQQEARGRSCPWIGCFFIIPGRPSLTSPPPPQFAIWVSLVWPKSG